MNIEPRHFNSLALRSHSYINNQITPSSDVQIKFMPSHREMARKSNLPSFQNMLSHNLSQIQSPELTGVRGSKGSSGASAFDRLSFTDKASKAGASGGKVKVSFNNIDAHITTALNSLNLVAKKDPSALSKYERFFGTFDQANFNRVKKTYVNLSNIFKSKIAIDYDANAKDGMYVNLAEPRKIYFTPNTIENINYQKWLTETFIHEMAHLAGAPLDIYGLRASQDLAKQNPFRATNNADNYAFYATSK